MRNSKFFKKKRKRDPSSQDSAEERAVERETRERERCDVDGEHCSMREREERSKAGGQFVFFFFFALHN